MFLQEMLSVDKTVIRIRLHLFQDSKLCAKYIEIKVALYEIWEKSHVVKEAKLQAKGCLFKIDLF